MALETLHATGRRRAFQERSTEPSEGSSRPRSGREGEDDQVALVASEARVEEAGAVRREIEPGPGDVVDAPRRVRILGHALQEGIRAPRRPREEVERVPEDPPIDGIENVLGDDA